MIDMMNVMSKVREFQKKMQEAQQNLGHLQTIGEAGGGLVKVTITGHRRILSVEIDSSILQTKDQLTVQDLVVAAVNKALDEAETMAQEELQKTTGGLPSIPGLDFSNFMR